MRQFGLIGYPLSHSFSKKYFEEKFIREGITDCSYGLFPIHSVYELKELVASTPGLEGLNVTIPYKQQVIQHLDEFRIEGLRACNCISISDGKLIGFNTDITGFENSLIPLLQPHHNKAIVLGNGGAASAVIFVLNKLGIMFEIVSRKLHDGSTLTYQMLNEKHIQDHKLIINTTPLGTYPDIGSLPDIPYQFIGKDHLLYDLVYNPAETAFLKKGKEKGAGIKNGYEMLVMQAEESWNIWNESER
ncbi:MAG: shikimate dehydrogenase family protein [Flavisolibacter sp.]